jgi:alkylated DNA repair dioxygenase AlkB
LYYFDNVITAAEQEACIKQFQSLVLQPVVVLNQASKRLKVSYGFEYDPKVKKLRKMAAIPDFLRTLRDTCMACCEAHGVRMNRQDELNQCAVQKYPPGAGIGIHIDSVLFGDTILGMSLGVPATMRFRHKATGHRYDVSLQPCSLLVIQGAVRFEWSHEIPGVSIKQQTRWSVTWRHYKRAD